MPKKEIQDYIFYKIVCLDDSCDLFYIGSTANWKARNYTHKHRCNNENDKGYNYKVYKTIRANGGWCNFKMIQIGTADQLTVRQAEEIEDEYRVQLKATMNGKRCYLSEEQKREQKREYRKEYYEANEEYFKEKQKEYRTNNKDKVNANASQKISCECGCEIRQDNLSTHKKTQKHINLMLG